MIDITWLAILIIFILFFILILIWRKIFLYTKRIEKEGKRSKIKKESWDWFPLRKII